MLLCVYVYLYELTASFRQDSKDSKDSKRLKNSTFKIQDSRRNKKEQRIVNNFYCVYIKAKKKKHFQLLCSDCCWMIMMDVLCVYFILYMYDVHEEYDEGRWEGGGDRGGGERE